MRAKTILTLLFLVSLCVVVVLGLRALPRHIKTDENTPGAKMLVAARALPAGALLRPKDVVWQDF
jgi:Flp pilus assembly protein CpaB